MRIALISDIHSNVSALQAVLERIDALQPDRILCMGDLVGYGPEPNECIDLVRGRGIPCVLGNHDAAVCGQLEPSFFLEPNRSVIEWTAAALTPENRAWLSELRLTLTPDEIGGFGGSTFTDWIMCHSSPVNPSQWEWLNSAVTCREVLETVAYQFVFVGHTHVPALVAHEMGVFGLEPGYRYIINPGAVGQSRDEDPRASFGLLDTDLFSYKAFRVAYPYQSTLAAYRRMGVDETTARRLLNFRN